MDRIRSIKELKLNLSLKERIPFLLMPGFFILISVLMFFTANLSSWINNGKKEINIISFTFLFLGIISMLFNNSLIKLTPVYSETPLNEKSKIIRELAEDFDWTFIKENPHNCFNFVRVKLFTMTLNILILTDEKGFYINVTNQTGSRVFNFGSLNVIADKIKIAIEDKLTSYEGKKAH